MRFAATLPAADMERAIAWYASVLQIDPVEIEENGDAWYEAAGTRFLLYASEFAGTNQATAAGSEWTTSIQQSQSCVPRVSNARTSTSESSARPLMGSQ